MAFYKTVLIFIFIACVDSKIEPFSPCPKDDLPCIQDIKQSFISKDYAGDEELDIKPIDPLEISAIEIHDNGSELALHFNNTNVTGLKDTEICDYKMDLEKQHVEFSLNADFTIVSDVGVEMTTLKKTFNGRYSATANVTESVQYSFSIKDVNGTDYFELGPETKSCDLVGEPTVSLKVTLQDDSDKEIYAKKPALDKAALRKKTICEVMDSATTIIVQNFRAATKAYPKSAFIKDD